MGFFRTSLLGAACACALAWTSTGALAADALQCVPYARAVSGVNLWGDALDWWDKADGVYERGHVPRIGAVMAFRPTGSMTLGHVAVVSKVVSAREVLIRHANWSQDGAIEEDVRAIDISDGNDWSEVRVWYTPGDQMGSRVNPVHGFIYPRAARAKLAAFDPEKQAQGRSWTYLTAPASARSEKAPDAAPPAAPVRMASAPRPASGTNARPAPVAYGTSLATATSPRRDKDGFIIEYLEQDAQTAAASRSLADIIADVKKQAKIG